MEPIPRKDSLFCAALKLLGFCWGFFYFWFSSQQHAIQYAKKYFQNPRFVETERIKKKAWDRQLAQYVALSDKKEVLDTKQPFTMG